MIFPYLYFLLIILSAVFAVLTGILIFLGIIVIIFEPCDSDTFTKNLFNLLKLFVIFSLFVVITLTLGNLKFSCIDQTTLRKLVKSEQGTFGMVYHYETSRGVIHKTRNQANQGDPLCYKYKLAHPNSFKK